MKYHRNQDLLTNARNLRKNMTQQERHLWYDFLRNCKPRFRRQEIIGNYIADFFCYEARLIIELDGSQHYTPEQIAYDAQRSEYFCSLGISVLRFSNTDINTNFDSVCQQILICLEERSLNPSVSLR